MAHDERVPVTMLSGFLGAGKTTVLRHLLENAAGMKFGCVINDVASVNVDAKLVRNDKNRAGQAATATTTTTSDLADTVELSNGCACCSIQDELFASIGQLEMVARGRNEPFDRIILENSGVAEPHNIRELFEEAAAMRNPLLDRIKLDTMVTVVDSHTFLLDYETRTPLAARPDLGEGRVWRPVVDLLVEQIECADFVLLNKVDLLAAGKLEHLTDIITSLNPLATVIPCEQGRVDLAQVFGRGARALVAHLNVEGQHRGAVAAARATQQSPPPANEGGRDHGHSPAAGHDGHSHQHADGHDHAHSDADGHGQQAHGAGDTKRAKVAEHGHEHGCGEYHVHDESCGHGHGHAHEHGHSHAAADRQETTAAKRYGIRSFVYSRRRPFHSARLKSIVLEMLPVARNGAVAPAAAAAAKGAAEASPIRAVLRSKGFMWMDSQHDQAFYWSHAGQHFEIRDEGDWWAAVPQSDWPTAQAQRDIILQDFDPADKPIGDRRQEIVFIGTGMDEAAIVALLDQALLSDEEMDAYRRKHWPSAPTPKA